jgi:2-keto-4-pentenoate hydratase/2-oxohepta-3-ene-1,7-dioic acid hydratase in catechol pathway
MKLVTYRIDIEAPARLGVIQDGTVVDVADFGTDIGLDFPDRMLDFIDLGPHAVTQLRTALEDAQGDWGNALALPIETVTLLAPIPKPRKNIFGIGLNYVDHVTESAKALDTDDALPKEPVVFSKPPTAVVGPGGPVRHDGNMTQQLGG